MSEYSWISSEHTVIERAQSILASNHDAVLATIVAVEGSAYRRPGAKMLVSDDGDILGSITAGCLEDEVYTLAADVLAAGTPRLETFDLMQDDVWGLGVGCNGVITILLEPVSTQLIPLIQAYETRDSALIATVLRSDNDNLDSWRRVSYTPEEGIVPADGGPPVPAWVQSSLEQPAAKLFGTQNSDSLWLNDPDGEACVFLDGIAPLPRLVAVGSNQDVRPVVELASKAGFQTTVVGYRGSTATLEQFPNADDVHSTSPAQIREAIEIDNQTYFAVMTHNFIDDRITVSQVAETPTPYIGLMGPRDRFEEMLDAYDPESMPAPDNLSKVYTPIGLDLGGGSPYQIAFSIVSELLAVHNGREPKHLQHREGSIHDHPELTSG